jgi:SAM-dependent methyltransferase
MTVSMKDRFERIYADNEWVYGSGEGSLLANAHRYVDFVERFMADRGVRSVVDFGCGDWQFSRHIRWGEAHYRGYDLVESLIATNRERFASERISFHAYAGDPHELPPADLLLVKDVLQHWPDRAIVDFLPILPRFRWALITNCVNHRGATVNTDTDVGGFRFLDLRLPPFKLAATEVLAYSHDLGCLRRWLNRPRWLKRVLLVENRP